MSQLPADCLNEIFEHLEDDKITLHSCLLVNRLWCEISVRILWKNVWNYNTLFTCLPNESKDILHNNEIIIPTQVSKPPMFNYATFCKILSINCVDKMFQRCNTLLKVPIINNTYNIIAQEIFKLFMNQTSLKKLNLCWYNFLMEQIIFTSYPGAKNCLKNLSELHCNSNIYHEIFYQLSQICHNIQSLKIKFKTSISNGLLDLISVQKNLKYLSITRSYDCKSLKNIILLIKKLPNTLIKLNISGGRHHVSISSFITKLINLQELELSFYYHYCFGGFEKLQYVVLSQLQILKIHRACPKYNLLIKFLENNGKNLKEFYVGDFEGVNDNSLNLAIANFCPNLRKLSTGFKNDEMETLKMVFNGCQYLESIKIWCGDDFFSEKEALEMILNYSRENICELILYHIFVVKSNLLPEELESFFISWSNFVPQKQKLSLIVVNDDSLSLDANDDNMEIIKKYIKLGVIKKFKVTDFNDTEFNLKNDDELLYDP